MQLVAAAKMKKAQDQAISGRDYAEDLLRVLEDLKANVNEEAHPLLRDRAEGRHLMFVISTDKGLCGGLNTNLLKLVRQNSDGNTDFVTVGRKLRTSLAKTKETLVADWHIDDPVPFDEARPIAKLLTEKFLSGDYNRVTIAYSKFITTMRQEPTIAQLLPIASDSLPANKLPEDSKNVAEVPRADYIFEPSTKSVLDTLLPLYVNFQVYQMLVESRASEHSSRMVAMKSATDNAEQMIKDLTLEYNKARQAAITSELLEITTAQKAME